ncbi:MAG: hypothetical protein JWN44_3855 [Myxococcales bacterium]|nr:hypothetical protein [Myxococcales bacterium]
MRIKGPGDGPRPTDAVDEAAPIDGVDETAAAETGAVGRVGGTGGTGGTDPIAQVAARLRAGEITSDQAVDLLIEDAIGRQMGGAVPKDLEPRLREVLRDYATNDPYLAAKIRRLTQAK